MMITSVMGIFALIFYLAIMLVPIALLVALQVWLCRKSLRLGLILPALSLLFSLVIVFSLAAFGQMNTFGGGGSLVLEENGQVVQESIYRDGMVYVYDGEGNLIEEYPDPNAQQAQEASGDRGPLPQTVGGMSLGYILMLGVVFLVSNIPTLIFGGIWLHFKNRRDLREDMKRMRIEDLG